MMMCSGSYHPFHEYLEDPGSNPAGTGKHMLLRKLTFVIYFAYVNGYALIVRHIALW
jgi:hypothetical protein